MKKVVILVIVSFILLVSTSCTKEKNSEKGYTSFSSLNTEKEFMVEFNNWDGKKDHIMYLEEDSKIHVVINNKQSENLRIYVTYYKNGEGEQTIYSASNPISTELSFTIPSNDNYTFRVYGKDAEGIVSFVVEDEVDEIN